MNDLSHGRLKRELRTVNAMVHMYCRHHHTPVGDLCANCPVHFYAPGQREQMRQVMRWAGPRMLLRHPVLVIAHLLDGRKKL